MYETNLDVSRGPHELAMMHESALSTLATPSATHLNSTNGTSGHDTSTVSVPRAEGNNGSLDISNSSICAESRGTYDS